MQHVKLGDLDVARIGLGAMSMSGVYGKAGTDTDTDESESIRTIHRAIELSTRSPPCSRSTPCGPATRRRRSCRCCASWGSASWPTPRSAAAS